MVVQEGGCVGASRARVSEGLNVPQGRCEGGRMVRCACARAEGRVSVCGRFRWELDDQVQT